MPIKVGDINCTTIDNVADGIRYAANNCCRIILVNFTTLFYKQRLKNTIDYAYDRGCFIIAPAGNGGENMIFYPAGFDNVFSVTSVDEQDLPVDGVNFEVGIDIAAPGSEIRTTDTFSSYADFGMTSASASIVAGVAGLVLSRDPNLSNIELRSIIKFSENDFCKLFYT